MAAYQLPKGVYRLGEAKPLTAPIAFPFGLGREGVHEVCERSFGDRTAALGFVAAHLPKDGGLIAAVSEKRHLADHGRWYETGLTDFSGRTHSILHIEARKNKDAHWATEEAARSGVASLVIAEMTSIDFTASRRLALVTTKTGVPIILLLPYAAHGSTAAAVRWRLSAQVSADNAFDKSAPGAARWRVVAERVRAAPDQAGAVFDLEFDYETLSLNLVSQLAAHTPQPHQIGRASARLRAVQTLRAG
ncbi:MAG: hypothetical protein AAGJ73_04570 [Pseudomonadota bacterium]